MVSDGKKFRRRADKRPDEVLDAALQLFMRDGFEATRVEDIGAVAGISKATVYLYFPSKAALLEGLVLRSISPVVKMATDSLTTFDGTGKEAISLLLDVMCRNLADPKIYAIPTIVMREANRFPDVAQTYIDQVLSRTMPALKDIIDKGIASGEFRDIDADMTIRNIAGPMILHMLLATTFGIGDISPDGLKDFADNHLDVLFNGISKKEKDNG